MFIPKQYRKQLRAIGFRWLFWERIHDWAFGERYRSRDRCIIYCREGEILSIRRGDRTLWRKYDGR